MRNMRGRSSVATPVSRVKQQTRTVTAVTKAPYLETFTGSNGNLGTVTTDLVWTVGAGQVPVVASNQCTTGASFGATGIARSVDETATTDHYAQCDWVTAGTNDQIFLFARNDAAGGSDPNSDNMVYAALFTSGGTDTDVQIDNWAGTGTQLSDTGLGHPVATWRLSVTGTTATLYRDGVSVLSGSIADFSPAPAGKHAGFELDSGTGHPVIDNFQFGDL